MTVTFEQVRRRRQQVTSPVRPAQAGAVRASRSGRAEIRGILQTRRTQSDGTVDTYTGLHGEGASPATDAAEYAPRNPAGEPIVAHGPPHVKQKSRGRARLIRRQQREDQGPSIVSAGEAAAQAFVESLMEGCNEFAPSACPSSGCPACFCSPLPLSRAELLALRDAVALYALPGIAVKVSPRVVPLWERYLYGGSRVQDLSAAFGADFASSQTTRSMNTIVERVLRTTIDPRRRLPHEIDIPSRIPSLVRQMNTPGHANQMNFDVIGEIPGNIAGGVGTDQTSCAVGAQPSPQNDRRGIEGTAQVVRNSSSSVTVIPDMHYVVEDTIDLCPGNCGADIEQIATLPFSWLEASGVSGDVPFRVRYPSGLAPFTVTS